MKTLSQNIVTILGSGTSTGTPLVGCKCPVCTSNNPKDNRLRCSIHIISKNNVKFLIDTTPDLRYQCLKYNITDLDFTLITHEHADHTQGIDDLRQICFLKDTHTLDIYASDYHRLFLEERYPYIFRRDKIFGKNRPILGGGIPELNLHTFKLSDNIITQTIYGEEFQFFLLPHNYTKTFCFFHDGLCYIPDCHEIPIHILDHLNKLPIKLLIINCLQKEDHDTHLSVEKSFKYIQKIVPKRAGLIHMNHNISHQELEKLAQESFDFPVFPVYDGLKLTY